MTRIQANLLLLLAAAIWGGGFVAQSTGMEAIGPFWFISLRFAIAALLLLPFALFEKRKFTERMTSSNKLLFICVGIALFGGASAQQVGLQTTTVTNSAFITGLYVIFVPLIAVIFLKKPPHWIVWPGAIMAATGIFLLSGGSLSALTKGDGFTLLCALCWAAQITLAGMAVKVTECPLSLSCAQFAVTALGGGAVALATESFSWSAVVQAAPEILYLGLFSSGLAFSLQIVGQRYTTPSQAAIFLSSEAVFGAALGALLLGERITVLGYAGCALMLAAMLVTELVPELAQRRQLARKST